MKMTERGRRGGGAVVAAVIGGGVFLGVTGEGPVRSGSAPAAAASPTAPASYADVVRQVLPSVVLIRTPDGLGSGVVLDRAGNIVTNAHVAGNVITFQVQVAGDPAPRAAHLVGSYPPDDLAVIRVGDPSGLQPARFGDSARAQAGDVVLAVGNPLGLSGSVTEGIISATGRAVTEPAAQGSAATTLPGAIQTTAAINPGNRGGALVNASGQVIGIPTLAAASPQSGTQAQGIGFAIPSNLARAAMRPRTRRSWCSVTRSRCSAAGRPARAGLGRPCHPGGTGPAAAIRAARLSARHAGHAAALAPPAGHTQVDVPGPAGSPSDQPGHPRSGAAAGAGESGLCGAGDYVERAMSPFWSWCRYAGEPPARTAARPRPGLSATPRAHPRPLAPGLV